MAAAAYRGGVTLRDQRYGLTHNYTGKRGVAHLEIMAPAGAPSWVRDREALWNQVEASEHRKDSQLARVIEVGLPIELSADQCLALLRDYIGNEFIAKGMVADFCIRGDAGNPHSHILLTLRGVTVAGFGPKERSWNGKATLLQWRSAWADRANEHLARAGHAVRIDHRTLEAQQIELTPGRRIGIGRPRRRELALPDHLAERIAEQQRIARANGETMLEDPSVALRALTHQRPTFTHRELAQFLRSRTGDAAQFDAVFLAVCGSNDLVALRPDEHGEERFTSRDMVEAEKSLIRRSASMVTRRGHGVAADRLTAVLSQFALDAVQRHAVEYLVAEGDAKAVAVTKEVKASLLTAARLAWETAGLAVMGAAPSHGAAENLRFISGITSRSLAEYEQEWLQGPDPLNRETVLLIDESQSIGLKQLERILSVADKARAKAVLIADSDQLQAMRVDSAFQEVLRQVGNS